MKKNTPNLLMAPIGDVQYTMHQLAVKKGWWPMLSSISLSTKQKREQIEATVPEKLALIHSEVSEALEEFRSNKRLNEVTFGEDDEEEKPEGFPVELADIVIRVFDLAQALNIDLGYWIARKYEYNATRKKRHGGKRA